MTISPPVPVAHFSRAIDARSASDNGALLCLLLLLCKAFFFQYNERTKGSHAGRVYSFLVGAAAALAGATDASATTGFAAPMSKNFSLAPCVHATRMMCRH